MTKKSKILNKEQYKLDQTKQVFNEIEHALMKVVRNILFFMKYNLINIDFNLSLFVK